MKKQLGLALCFASFICLAQAQAKHNGLQLNNKGYLEMPGLNVTSFADIYPDGHQTGVTIIQHGLRVAANGDLRLEASPGQWSPVPAGGELQLDAQLNRISQTMHYPDESKNRKGFNPIIYPDLSLSYTVHVEPVSGSTFKITVDLEQPIPKEWVGKVGFNMELFPTHLFGQSWLMDDQMGIFPNQANGPIVESEDGNLIATHLAKGHKLTVAAEEPRQTLQFSSEEQPLVLLDGRTNHNNGWFIVRSAIPANRTKSALEWTITANVIEGWQYEPVIQVSQVGYHPQQQKLAIFEQDGQDDKSYWAKLLHIDTDGPTEVLSKKSELWGEFLRYQYATFDFSEVNKPGMYQIEYRGQRSHPFSISEKVYDRHVWQPTLEYYLPVQMCHMRVNEKYRVWHDHCHQDDALMAPTDLNHFDGYISGHNTLTEFHAGDAIDGLNQGGWHDAGDYDLRVESQIGTVWLLAKMVEEFSLSYDATMIDQKNHLVEIHQPDGISDAIQQIEHGLHTVLGGYRSLGRLYRGIIVPELRQYVMLGDAASQTDQRRYNPELAKNETRGDESGRPDDRWVFTENNPSRELQVVAGLATAARVIASDNASLAREALEAAEHLYKVANDNLAGQSHANLIFASAELWRTTGKKRYLNTLLSQQQYIVNNIERTGWMLSGVINQVPDKSFKNDVATAVKALQERLSQKALNSPFGVPYEPNIWGAGWTIQRFGVEQYFFHQGWPQYGTMNFTINALNFILGVHPGENTMSFASGVGSESATVAYGVNRADWSHIPGGVISGTALIRPDLPELKIWPFFWQQTEYVMGGGATNFMFIALATQQYFAQ